MTVLVDIPSTNPRTTQTVTLDAADYRIEFTWRERLASWYVSLYTLGGEPLVQGRRYSRIGFNLALELKGLGGPPGQFFTIMPEAIERTALGSEARLFYIPEAQVDEAVARFNEDRLGLRVSVSS